MTKKLLTLTLSLVFSTLPGFVQAEGNAATGRTKAANCASCHGETGNSMVPTFPKLAGQHAGYLINQLHAFKDNSRNAPMMVPLAMGLDSQAIEDIAAYYASQTISTNQLPIIDSDDDEDDGENASSTDEDKAEELNELLALGRDLYRNGNLETKVPACNACHGPKAEGNKPSSFPALRSQHADYLIQSLTDFKNGVRSPHPDDMMAMIARKMTDIEIQAVSYHISMLQ